MSARTFEPAQIRNIALLGHGFSGKTALGEAILFNCGVTTRLGRTDQGTSVFDFEPEEQKRCGSIASAFAWVEHRDVKINIIDTPGDQNFMYDSFAALHGADCALVLISAPDGVEVQTVRVWDKALEMQLPRILFVNKMDRERADWDRVLADIEDAMGVKPLAVQIPIGAEHEFKGVVDLFRMKALTWKLDGSSAVTEADIPPQLMDEAEAARENLVESIASTDDDLLEEYLETFEISPEKLMEAFKNALHAGEIVPVLMGSASHNAGIQPLLDLLVSAAPSPLDLPDFQVTTQDDETITRQRSADAPFIAQVVRTFMDEFSGKVTIMRIMAGRSPDDGSVVNSGQQQSERLGTLHVQKGKEREPIEVGVCGDIVAVAKLKVTHTNDTLSDPRTPHILPPQRYPPPMMAFVINPTGKGDEDRLKVAVERLIEEDPTLSISHDELSKQMVINGMGQAHLEASIEKMKRKFKVAVTTALPSVPYRETFARQISNVEGKHKKQTGGAGQFGVCYLDVEPLPRGEGLDFVNKIFGGAIPRQFIPSVEKGIRERMKHGILAGYPVVDIRVTLVDGKYHPVDSKDIAYQLAASKGLKVAMEQAGMKLLEPFYSMEIVTPNENMGDIMGDITSRRGRVLGMDTKGRNTTIRAVCPLAEVQRYAPDLKSITGGKGTFVMEFQGYEDVPFNLVDKVKSASPFTDSGDDED